MPRFVAALVLVVLPAVGRADDADVYERKVRPVLAEHCFSCHSAAGKKVKGGLTLDTPDGIRRGAIPGRRSSRRTRRASS